MNLEDVIKWGILVGLTSIACLGIQKANAETLLLQEQQYSCGIEYKSSKFTERIFMLDNGHVIGNYYNEGNLFGIFDGRNMIYDTNTDGIFDKVEETFVPDYKTLCKYNPNYKRI